MDAQMLALMLGMIAVLVFFHGPHSGAQRDLSRGSGRRRAPEKELCYRGDARSYPDANRRPLPLMENARSSHRHVRTTRPLAPDGCVTVLVGLPLGEPINPVEPKTLMSALGGKLTLPCLGP